MNKLTSIQAIKLLFKDVVYTQADLEKYENRWVKHCLFVGIAADRIAKRLDLDHDYVKALGYIHDIGRKIKHIGHPMLGYQYMIAEGFKDAGKICITHSFINNDVTLTAGQPPSKDALVTISQFLSNFKLTTEDNIIQLCDLFCLDTGFTTIEKRLIDITTRKGVTQNSMKHFESVMALKDKLEKQMNCSLYSLFPEINKDDIDNINLDRKQLIELIKHGESEQKCLKLKPLK